MSHVSCLKIVVINDFITGKSHLIPLKAVFLASVVPSHPLRLKTGLRVAFKIFLIIPPSSWHLRE